MREKPFITHSRDLRDSLIRQGLEFTGETGDGHTAPKTYYFVGNLERLGERARAGIEMLRYQDKNRKKFSGR